MPPNYLWSLVIAGLFLSFFVGTSLQLLVQALRHRKQIIHAWGRVPASPLNWADFLFYCAACFLAVWKFPSLLPAVAVGGALALHLAHQGNALRFWGWNFAELPLYLWSGVKTYYGMLIPFLLITWTCFLVFSKFGYDDTTQPVVKLFLDMKTPSQVVGFLVLACVIAPIWEETVFRGMLYPFLKNKTGAAAAMILSAGFWSAIHQHPPTFVPLLLLGFVLTTVYETTGKLGYCIGLHSVFNSCTCLVLLAYKYGPHGSI